MASIALLCIRFHRMAGGIERNAVYLANKLVSRKCDVKLLTFDVPNAESFYDLDPRVIWKKLGRGQLSVLERFGILIRMRRALKTEPRTEILVCFHHGLLPRALAATMLCGLKIVNSERHALSIYTYISRKQSNLSFRLMAWAWKITVQFPGYIADYPAKLRPKIRVVHNPVYPYTPLGGQRRDKIVLSIGRIEAQKRMHLLVEAWPRILTQAPGWRLVIVGDGAGRAALDQQIKALGLAGAVTLLPPQKDLRALFETATLYCQPSQWEGFPNAQAEAMSAGLIPSGFRSTKGVADLIEAVGAGYLFDGPETAETLASGLLKAIGDQTNHESQAAASMRITEIFGTASWFKAWEEVFEMPLADT